MHLLNMQNDIERTALAFGGTAMVFDAARFESSGISEFRYRIVPALLMLERGAWYHWKELVERFKKN
jgi:hypothetical protein